MINALKNTSIQTLLAVLCVLLFHESIPLDWARGFYTLSLTLKDVLLAILPLSICVFIASTLNSFKKRGYLLVVSIALFELVSNACASFAAYGLSFWGASLYKGGISPASISPLVPFQIEGLNFKALLPRFWRVEYGTAFGIVLGLFMPYVQSTTLEKMLTSLSSFLKKIFNRFSRLIPLLVVGFFFNLLKITDFKTLFLQGGKAISIMIMGITGYVILLYFIVGRFSIKKTAQALQNALPAGLTAFSSMCSLSSMPITIQATEKNLNNPRFASMVIPATTNIQQVGDCFIQVFLCCMILSFFGHNIPNLTTFLAFLGAFVLARFTTVAVLGGAFFIMLPLYQKYFGFNEEMIAMLLIFNMILDPIVTSSNVMANSALCVLFERFWDKISGVKRK
jgi:Na+/H+-dicarboxylate symporter